MNDWSAGPADGPRDPEEDGALAADRELEAAIEYKIALSGVSGVERILELVRNALWRSGGFGGEPGGASEHGAWDTCSRRSN